MGLLHRAGKAPIRVRGSPGFIANRLQFALLAEALRCLDEGLATVDDIDTVVRSTFGFRLAAFGPFAIADMAGLDVCVSVLETLEDDFGDHFAHPRDPQTALVERGDLGAQDRSGFRRHDPEESDDRVTRRAQVYSSHGRLRIQNLLIEIDRSERAGYVVVDDDGGLVSVLRGMGLDDAAASASGRSCRTGASGLTSPSPGGGDEARRSSAEGINRRPMSR